MSITTYTTANPLPLVFVGGGMGTTALVSSVAAVNRKISYPIVSIYVDPAVDKLGPLVNGAARLNMKGAGLSGRIEDNAAPLADLGAIFVSCLDTALPIASLIAILKVYRSAMLGYLFLNPFSGVRYGIRWVFQGHEQAERELAIHFFTALAGVTARGSSRDIIGNLNDTDTLAREQWLRKWCADHLMGSLPKLANGLEPKYQPMEVTTNGRETQTLLLVDHRNGWRPAQEAIEEVMTTRSFPMRPWALLVIGQIGPDGIRLHHFRLNSKRIPVLSNSTLLDATSLAEQQKRVIQEKAMRVQLARLND